MSRSSFSGASMASLFHGLSVVRAPSELREKKQSCPALHEVVDLAAHPHAEPGPPCLFSPAGGVKVASGGPR